MNGKRFLATFILLPLLWQLSLGQEPSIAPIRVGVLHSLSGTMEGSESSLVDAINMAIDEINQSGGVLGRPLKAIVEDGRSDSATFAQKAEKLIVEDKVVSIFGCWTSACRKAVLPIVEKHNHLLWYPVQYEGRESSANIIYTGAAPNQQIIPAIDWCYREFGPRMFLIGSDYVFPRTANEIIKQRLEDYGVKPVSEQYRSLGSKDFAEIVAEILKSRPDVVLNTLNGSSNRDFFQTLEDAGSKAEQIPVMSFSIAEDELRDIGVDSTVGHYCSWNYFQSIDTPANRRFVREFKQRYGEHRVTDDPIEAAYFQVYLFAKAVELAGSTEIDEIRRATRGLIYAAPEGLVRIDPQNQHTWKVSRIGRIQPDGQFKIVWSSDDPLPPRPYLPATFLANGISYGQVMFHSVNKMIELEADEAPDKERRKLLVALADVRGFLGDARTKFRSAVLESQSQNRLAFEEAWGKLDKRWATLRDKQQQLTDEQRGAFENFGKAREQFHENATIMFEALYPAEQESDEVTP